jgi:EmrB/QacA subfamily drug resistance transporter
MATFMAAVESTIIATAMPSVVADLGGFSLFSWAFSAYLLTQAVSIPVYGRLADIHGRKRLFFAGAFLFTAGSILCGFATSMPVLIACRAIQGFGAGGVQPMATTILGDIYSPTERARVQGLVSSVFGVSAVLGPSLGAFLVQHIGWPSVFWVNLPIAVAAIAMIAAFLDEHVTPRQHRVDYAGSALLMLSVGAVMLLLVQGGSLDVSVVLISVAVALLAGAVLAWHEARITEPMLPLELWRDPIIVTGSLGSCIAGAVMMGISAFLPAYVQGVLGRSPAMAGAVLGVMSVTWALASFGAGRLMVRTSYRRSAMCGALALIAGCGVLITLTPDRGPLWAGTGSLLIGIGMGLSNTTFIVSVQAAVPWQRRGAATSSMMFLRFIGQAFGAASFGAVLNLTLHWHANPAAPDASRLLDAEQRAALPPDDLARLTDLIAAGLHNAYLLAFILSCAALVIAWRIPSHLSPVRGNRDNDAKSVGTAEADTQPSSRA